MVGMSPECQGRITGMSHFIQVGASSPFKGMSMSQSACLSALSGKSLITFIVKNSGFVDFVDFPCEMAARIGISLLVILTMIIGR